MTEGLIGEAQSGGNFRREEVTGRLGRGEESRRIALDRVRVVQSERRLRVMVSEDRRSMRSGAYLTRGRSGDGTEG